MMKQGLLLLLLLALALALLASTTSAFTTSVKLHPPPYYLVRRTSLGSSNAISQSFGAGLLFANDGDSDTTSSSIAAAAAAATTKDSVLKEFEKREAAILQRKADAVAKLSHYEESLNALQTKKREYMANTIDTPVADSFSETAWRSAVKAFVWRVVAGSVTFVTTLQFSGSMQQALKVVGADFFSKAFTMFIGERLMNKSQAGRRKGGDNAGRSLAKALIWRLFAICNTLTVAVFIAKDLSVASKIASTDAVFKTALMFGYERLWARINWGKEYLIEFSI